MMTIKRRRHLDRDERAQYAAEVPPATAAITTRAPGTATARLMMRGLST